MINCGQFNFNDLSTPGQALVVEKSTNGLNVLTTPPTGTGPLYPVLTVATLPTAATGIKGMVVAVSDATTPALGTALAGGGAVFCLALCTGAAWVAV